MYTDTNPKATLREALSVRIKDSLAAGNSYNPNLKLLVLSSKYLDQVLEVFFSSMVNKEMVIEVDFDDDTLDTLDEVVGETNLSREDIRGYHKKGSGSVFE